MRDTAASSASSCLSIGPSGTPKSTDVSMPDSSSSSESDQSESSCTAIVMKRDMCNDESESVKILDVNDIVRYARYNEMKRVKNGSVKHEW